MASMTLERSRIIDAPVSQVWKAVADLDDYHRHAASLVDTEVISGHGQDARRRCVDSSGNKWEETCTIWEPEHRYVIDVDVTTYPAKYRALFRSFRGSWTVEAVGDATNARIRFDAELRRIPGMTRLVRRLSAKSATDLDAILESYANTVETPRHQAG